MLFRSIFRSRSRRHYLTHRETARRLIHERVRHFLGYYATRHGLSVRRIAVRNQKSRWGSCSKEGNLNFNYKLAFLPPELCDYVVVHELCHLKEFNHSRAFWALVAEAVPDYKVRRQHLRRL